RKILAFISEWNEEAAPFNWTEKSFAKTLAKVDAVLAAHAAPAIALAGSTVFVDGLVNLDVDLDVNGDVDVVPTVDEFNVNVFRRPPRRRRRQRPRQRGLRATQ